LESPQSIGKRLKNRRRKNKNPEEVTTMMLVASNSKEGRKMKWTRTMRVKGMKTTDDNEDEDDSDNEDKDNKDKDDEEGMGHGSKQKKVTHNPPVRR
jgi:hypothetical protein